MSSRLDKFESKLKSINSRLGVRQTTHPYIDKITFDKRDLFSIPKDARFERAVYNSYVARTDPKDPSKVIPHRSLAGTLNMLIERNLISKWDRKKWIGI